MGSYIYKIKPSATVLVRGIADDYLVHNSEFAFKPYSEYGFNGEAGEKANRRMMFTCGVHGCENAWKRRDDHPNFIGTFGDSEKWKIGDEVQVFLYPKTWAAGHYNDDQFDYVAHRSDDSPAAPVGTAIYLEDGWAMKYRQLDAQTDWIADEMERRAIEKPEVIGAACECCDTQYHTDCIGAACHECGGRGMVAERRAS